MLKLKPLVLLLSMLVPGFPAEAWGRTFIAYDENEIPITPDHFDIEVLWNGPASIPMFIKITRNSLIWKRRKDGNKFPQLTLSLNIQEQSDLHLIYQGRTYIPELQKGSHIFIDVDVFSNEAIQIARDGKILGQILVKPFPEFLDQHYLYIDPSCAPYFVELDHTEDFFTSMSCEFHANPDRRGILDVSFSPAEGRLAGEDKPPYSLQLTGNGQSRLKLFLRDKPFEATLKARVPEYVARFKMALGLGPYQFETRAGLEHSPYHLAMSYMLYARYDLTESTSLRFFDALLNSGPFFNNAGGYFAYNVGSTEDGRIAVFPLLGFQGISFKSQKDAKLFQQIIFPQGFEVVYRHAFGLRNYHLIYGMFLSTASDGSYENIWLRYGQKVFWELNWINWKYEDRQATSYGLSVGIPFLSL
jgi:hypothetical protein